MSPQEIQRRTRDWLRRIQRVADGGAIIGPRPGVAEAKADPTPKGSQSSSSEGVVVDDGDKGKHTEPGDAGDYRGPIEDDGDGDNSKHTEPGDAGDYRGPVEDDGGGNSKPVEPGDAGDYRDPHVAHDLRTGGDAGGVPWQPLTLRLEEIEASPATPEPDPQYGRAASTIDAGDWEAYELNTTFPGAPLHEAIDELPPADDAITDIRSTGSTSACVLGLSELADPGRTDGHVLRMRWRATAGVTGGTLACALQNADGSTIATIGPLALTDSNMGWADAEITLSDVEASAIDDYADLRVRFEAAGVSGTAPKARVSWLEFEVPGV